MKAAVLREYKTPLKIEEVAIDEPKRGEVLVRIAASGICGSDIHVANGASNIQGGLPLILGHEGAGVVEEVGPDVVDLKRGDRVIISMSEPCGHCSYCNQGHMELCSDGTKGVFGEMADGTYRKHQGDEIIHSFTGIGSLGEYTVVSRKRLTKLEFDAPFESVCLIPCGVITGMGAVFNASDVKPGSSVIVFGCGGVGVSIIQAARIAGAARIIAIDINQAKLDLAANLGATDCILSPEDPNDLAAEVFKILPHGADFAFDAVGRRVERISELMGMTEQGGLTVAVGMIPWNQTVPVLGKDIMLSHRRLTGVAGGNAFPGREIPRILRLYETGRLKLDELVGQSFELNDINEAFAVAAKADTARTIVRVSPQLL